VSKKKKKEDAMRDRFYAEVMKNRTDKKDVVDDKLTEKLKKKLRIEMNNARKSQ
jgi:hypothetical protein